jgi:hypothetical protein
LYRARWRVLLDPCGCVQDEPSARGGRTSSSSETLKSSPARELNIMNLLLNAIKLLARLSIVAMWRKTYFVTLTNGQWYRVRAHTAKEAEESFGPKIGRIEVLSVVEDD